MIRLWERVDQSSGEHSCWPWLGARNERGYGIIRIDNRNVRTHRLALGLEVALSTKGVVMHTCDNPPCCNPLHLIHTAQADNVADMHSKGRRRYSSRLTDEDVASIRSRRANGEGPTALAVEYGVSQAYISMICLGQRRSKRGVTHGW